MNPQKYTLEFDRLMEFCLGYESKKSNPAWVLLQQKYADWRGRSDRSEHIPRHIHQIWLGGNMPSLYPAMIDEVKLKNPGFEHRLWTESNIDFPLETGDLIDKVSNYGQKSDILRYEILKRFGGIYLDLDFVAQRSFDPLLNLGFFTGLVYGKEPALANGLMGSIPTHPIINNCLENLTSRIHSDNIESIINTTGPHLLQDVVMKMLPDLTDTAVLPNAYFYPFPNFPQNRILGGEYRAYIKPETICVHLWHCSWMKTQKAAGVGIRGPSGINSVLKKVRGCAGRIGAFLRNRRK